MIKLAIMLAVLVGILYLLNVEVQTDTVTVIKPANSFNVTVK